MIQYLFTSCKENFPIIIITMWIVWMSISNLQLKQRTKSLQNVNDTQTKLIELLYKMKGIDIEKKTYKPNNDIII